LRSLPWWAHLFVWTIGIVGVLLLARTEPILAAAVLLISILACWAVSLAIALAAPPLPPLASTNILVARLVWLVKMLWSATIMGVAAFLGVAIGYDANEFGVTSKQVRSDVFLPLEYAAFILPWMVAMVIAIDMIRLREERRAAAARRCLDRLMEAISGPPDSADGSPCTTTRAVDYRWVDRLAHLARPLPALIFGYAAPVVAMVLVMHLVEPNSAAWDWTR
jgi:hypothetical protein